jgi:hypothetical protein
MVSHLQLNYQLKIYIDISSFCLGNLYPSQVRMNFANFMKIYYASLYYLTRFLKFCLCEAVENECEKLMMAQYLLYYNLGLPL